MALYGTIPKAGGVDAIAGLAEAGVAPSSSPPMSTTRCASRASTTRPCWPPSREIARTGLMVAIHNEDQELVEQLTAEARAAGRTDPIMHAAPARRWPRRWPTSRSSRWRWRPGRMSTSRIPRSPAASTWRRPSAARARKATGEACIQYLCMTEEDIVRLAGFGKCNPPFRTAAEVERMWAALAGRSPMSRPTTRPGRASARPRRHLRRGAGLTGLQSFAPLMYTLLAERGLPPTRWRALRRAAGALPRACRKGRIRRLRRRPAGAGARRLRLRRGRHPGPARKCAGRPITAARCGPAWPRPCCAGNWYGMTARACLHRERDASSRAKRSVVTASPPTSRSPARCGRGCA